MLIQIKKYWKIALIILISALILFYYVFLKSEKDDIDPKKTSDKLKKGLDEIKDKITEVRNTAVVESAIAKTKVEEVKKDLNEISKNKDAATRRTKLAELAKRVS
jgi:uncharacterized protein YpmS